MKQKILPLLLALLTAYMPASAYDFMTDDGLCYNINSDGTSVTVTYDPSYSNLNGDLTIPPSVTNDGTNYSVTSIDSYAFKFCTGLTSVTIPNSVTSIGADAFTDCSGLTSVTIPNSVITIDRFAFQDCTGLISVTIPSSVTSIGIGAFNYCSGLTSIVVENGNTEYDSRNNCNAIIETWTNTLIAGCMNTIIPNSVTSIGYQAFYGCSGLTSVAIPNSVTSIGYQAFGYCNSMTDIYTYIEDPSSVWLYSNVFFKVPTSTCILHVPGGTAELYRAADQWSAFINIFEDMTGIDNIATDHKSDGIYYNLLGQPVKNPTTGIYIYNGKKVFKK